MKKVILLTFFMNFTSLHSGNFFKQSGLIIVDKVSTVALAGGAAALFWHFGLASKLTAGFLASIRTNLDAATKQNIASIEKSQSQLSQKVYDFNNVLNSMNQRYEEEKERTKKVEKNFIERMASYNARLTKVEQKTEKLEDSHNNTTRKLESLEKRILDLENNKRYNGNQKTIPQGLSSVLEYTGMDSIKKQFGFNAITPMSLAKHRPKQSTPETLSGIFSSKNYRQ